MQFRHTSKQKQAELNSTQGKKKKPDRVIVTKSATQLIPQLTQQRP